jgi:hypothetical protein
MTRMRPHELRQLLESEVRAALEDARASAQAVDPLYLVGTVLARHQHRDDVRGRLEFLWTYLEAYVLLLETLAREPP